MGPDPNTTVRNSGAISSYLLASNLFQLGGPGTYYISWSAPAIASDAHQTRLQNITDSTTAATGTSEFGFNTQAVQTRSVGSAVITIAAT